MVTLCGFAISNYYNKVKIQLLEKGVPFQEELNWASKDEATLSASPLGKVPFLRAEDGTTLCESQVIVEYIEDLYPVPPLMPSDPLQRAKIRELTQFLELHLELVARRVYGQAFFGGKVEQSVIDATRKELERNVKAFSRLTKYAPFIGGDMFTVADCAAIVSLPLVSSAAKAVWGDDPLAGTPARDYIKRMGERPSVQKVNADRKACVELRAKMAAEKKG
jgi:glutathione S-transferase